MISGSYSPGDLFLFRGLGKGEYAKRMRLCFTDGKPVRVGNASAATLADWNRDGRLDLIVGNIDGEVCFLPNVSVGKSLAFGPKQAVSTPGGKVAAEGDAGPLVADWNGDGVPDLLVGSGDGSVTLHRGSGKEGVPLLAQGEILLPASPAEARDAIPCEADPANGRLVLPAFDRPSIRSKLAVHDWNGDGRLDLLVGDLVTVVGPKPKLSEEQVKERAELEHESEILSQKISDRWSEAGTQVQATWQGAAKDPKDPDVQEELFRRIEETISRDEAYRSLRSRYDEIEGRLERFRPESAAHGFVWVYLRKS